MIRTFEVIGESDAEAPEADPTIAATEEGFDVPRLEPGEHTVELRNADSRPRSFNLVVFAPGKGLRDVEA